MANEGMTKPTYSELEAENLRVRGLLQRLIVYGSYHATCLACDKTAVIDAGLNPVHEPDCWLVKELSQANGDSLVTKEVVSDGVDTTVPPNFPQSPSLTEQGAESADIGKLDTADKKHAMINTPRNFSLRIEDESGVEIGKVNRVDEKASAEKCPDCAGRGYTCERAPMGGYGHHNVQCWTCKGTGKLAGSAETGGEKAASENCTECGDVRLSTNHGVNGHDFKEKTMEDLEMQIRKEIYRAASLLGAKSDLLGVIGSWGDTLPDADILQHLKDWNEGESSLSSPPPKEK